MATASLSLFIAKDMVYELDHRVNFLYDKLYSMTDYKSKEYNDLLNQITDIEIDRDYLFRKLFPEKNN